MPQYPPRRLRGLAAAFILLTAFGTHSASANPVYWTDWQTGDISNGFTGTGQITTATTTVDVTYHNGRGIGFYLTGAAGEPDYWTSQGVRDPLHSPYTSALVDNIPTGTDMIALQYAGTQTLTFSQAIANPVFSYISLNGNGYAFDQDFDILSFGDSSTSDGIVHTPGYYGYGTSYKNVVDLGGGQFEYQLLGTGEPHGTIRFKGSFDSVSWRSLSNEYWNGFTVGVQGTAAEIFTPEPSSIVAAAFGVFAGVAILRKRRSN